MTACRTALLCLLLGLLAPGGAGASEEAAQEPVFVAPEPGALITGAFTVHVVTPRPTSSLEVRVLRGDTVLVGPDEVADSTVTEGARHWRTRLDLSPLPNGLATVQVRPAASTPGSDASWTGVMVLLAAHPAAPILSATPGAEPGAITAAWAPLDIPDLLEARLEHAGPGDEQFALERTLDRLALARSGQHVLSGLAPGEHRLRLTAVRMGHDGPLETASDTVVVPVPPVSPAEPADETAEATAEPEPPADTRVRASGGSEPHRVGEPARAEVEPAPEPSPQRRAAMRRTAPSQQVDVAGPQVAAPQAAAPEAASVPERASGAVARPPAATLTIGHPDRLVAEQGGPVTLLAMLLAGLMLARRTRHTARR